MTEPEPTSEQMNDALQKATGIKANFFSPDRDGLWACHEAEKTLARDVFHGPYKSRLIEIVEYPEDAVSATPNQRALALFRTLCRP